MLCIVTNFLYFHLGNVRALLYRSPFGSCRIGFSPIFLSIFQYINQLVVLVFSFAVVFIEGPCEYLNSHFSNFTVPIQTLSPYLRVIYSAGLY
jgi:hypothetical protein